MNNKLRYHVMSAQDKARRQKRRAKISRKSKAQGDNCAQDRFSHSECSNKS